MGNVKKAETLGMPHGTATNRLRKQVLFHLLQKYNENVCFKCSKQIETSNDLSIEHKQPWEGISAELFWDLNNIAFSHLRCNTPHRFAERLEDDRGCIKCCTCKQFLPKESFTRRLNSKDRYRSECRQCNSNRRRVDRSNRKYRGLA